MKFKTSCPKEEIAKKEVYEIVIEFIHGDADHFTQETIGTFTENELDLLEEAVIICRKMKKSYPQGRGGDDNYNDSEDNQEDIENGWIKDYNLWFSPDNYCCEHPEDEHNPRIKKAIEHPYDIAGCGNEATFENFEVIYYDKNGMVYEVDVID